MLKIRKEQMETLDAHMMRKYEQRVMKKIAAKFPERYKQDGSEKMLELVRAGIHKAEKHSITEDDDVELFILVLVEHGLSFEQKPEMAECRDILEDEDMPGDAKVSMIYDELEAEDEDSDEDSDED